LSRCGFSDKPAVYRSAAETLEPGVAGCVSLATAKGYGASPHPAIPWKRGLQRLQVKGGALRLRFHEIVRYRKLLRVCVQYWGVKPQAGTEKIQAQTANGGASIRCCQGTVRPTAVLASRPGQDTLYMAANLCRLQYHEALQGRSGYSGADGDRVE
jgi:hypothetical protein